MGKRSREGAGIQKGPGREEEGNDRLIILFWYQTLGNALKTILGSSVFAFECCMAITGPGTATGQPATWEICTHPPGLRAGKGGACADARRADP